MNTNEELRQQMWELAYGLLAPDEVAALHARIKSDPVAARLYAEVRLQTDLVADAAKVSDPTIQFQPQGPSAIVRPIPAKRPTPPIAGGPRRASKGMNWLAGLAGTALAALLCLVLFRPATHDEQLASRLIVTTVEVPDRLQAGVSQQVSVFTSDVDEVGRPAEVELRLVDAAGQERLRRSLRTGEDGLARVDLPGPAIEPGVTLEFSATGPATPDRTQDATAAPPLIVAADVVPEPVDTFVLVDKPAYAPEDTVNFTTRNLTRFSKRLVSESTSSLPAADLEASPRQQSPLASESLAQGGIGGTLQPAPADQARMKKSLEGEGDRRGWYYFPEVERVLPELAERQLGSQRVAGTDRPDADNADAFVQREPQALAAGAAPAPPQAAVASVAQGMAAVPADASEDAQTEPDQPSRIAAGQPIEFPLPADGTSRYLVTLQCADRLVASQRVTRSEPLTPSAERSADESNAAATAASPAPPVVSLDPPPEVDGEMVARIYDDTQHPPQLIEQRRYFREPAARLQLALTDLKPHYAAGEQVRLTVQVVDERNRPVDATLAVRIWNERLVQAAGAPVADLATTFGSQGAYAMFGRTPQLGALAYGGRFDQANPSSNQPANGAQDLDALSRASDDLAMESAPGMAGQAVADVSFMGELGRMEVSNLVEVQAAYEASLAEARQAAAERKTTIGRLLLIGGLVALGLLGMQALLRASAKTSVWLPTVVLAGASLVIGAVWLSPRLPQGEVFQTAAAPEEMRKESAGSGPSMDAEPAAEGMPAPANEAAEQTLDKVEQAIDAVGSKDAAPMMAREAESRTPGQDGSDRSSIGTFSAPPASPAAPAAASSARSTFERADVPTPAPASADFGPTESKQVAPKPSPAPSSAPAEAARIQSADSLGDARQENVPDRGKLSRRSGAGKGASPPAARLMMRSADEQSGRKEQEEAENAPPAPTPDFGDDAEKSSTGRARRFGFGAAKKDVSTDPASLLFQPLLTTDARGQAVIEFTLPENDSEYRVLIDAIGHGRVGSLQQVIVGKTSADDASDE